jgi:hypothetical protein
LLSGNYDHQMPALLPTPFLFRFLLPVAYRDRLPADLDETCTLPLPATLDEPRLSEVLQLRAAWNAEGLAFAARVRGKSKPPQGSMTNPLAAEGLQLWIDTRGTQNVHRASRFCHHFCLLASGGAVQVPIPRAREESPLAKPDDLQVTVARHKQGYDLTAWIPETALHGFDPDASPRLGFFARLRDSELGDRHLTVGPEFPFATDPSVWCTLDLVRS